MSINPIMIVMIILTDLKSEKVCSAIDLHKFSVPTAVKKGTIAVKSCIAFWEVHFEAKHEIAATNKNNGIKTLEYPYTENSICPKENSILFLPGPKIPKSSPRSINAIEKKAAAKSKSIPTATFGLLDDFI